MIGYGALLIAVLVLVSGVIAYVGDVLGRWLGRRRVTLFGLRPRHTAMLISVVAGMLIAGWTLGASMAVSQDVRDGLTRVVALRQQIGDLKASASVLGRQNGLLKQQERSLREQAASSRKAADQALAERHKAEDSLAAADKELATRKARLARVSSDLAEVEKQLYRATRKAFELTRKVNSLEAQRTTLEQQTRELAGWRARAMSTFAHIYTAPLIAQAGEPLLDATVDAGKDKADVRRSLDAFVRRLEKLAGSRGAERKNGQGPVVVQMAVADEESKKVTLYGQDAVLNLLADAISEMGGSVIVRALSIGNTVKGEAILVEFQLFKNRQIFERGEVIAEATVDGSLPEARVLAALVDLLRNEVGAHARQQGVLPAIQESPDARAIFPSPAMPVGEVSIEALLSLADQIREKGGPVRVIARAAQDTWTAGPLGVELSVAAS